MSQGLQLLGAVIAANSRAAVRMIDLALFTEGEELNAATFFLDHYRAYGAMPTALVMRENGHRVLSATQPVTYYVDRARNRSIGRAWASDHPAFAQAMASANIPEGQIVLERMLRASRSLNNSTGLVSLVDAGTLVREDYEFAREHVGLRGITHGWDFMDRITLGQAPGDVTVFVARPGVGKTWTMLFSALKAWQAGHSVLFVTMEMTVLQTARRLVGMLSGINPKAIREGRMSVWAQHLFYDCVQDLATGAPFHFVAGDLERSVQDVDNLIQELTPDIGYVDAAYLLNDENRGGQFAKYSKHEAMQNVFKGVKQTSQRRNIPLAVSVQFNRQASAKDGTKGLENIGGSDWIGQIASNVVSIELGEEPNQRTTRRYTLQKVRDGEDGATFETDFLFAPFSMEFRREVLPEAADASAAMAQLAQDMM